MRFQEKSHNFLCVCMQCFTKKKKKLIELCPSLSVFGVISAALALSGRLHDPTSKSASLKINDGRAFPLCVYSYWIANGLFPCTIPALSFWMFPPPAKYKGKEYVLGILTLFSENECLWSRLDGSYVTLEIYSSHMEGAYLFSLCKPHVEGIWVFAFGYSRNL